MNQPGILVRLFVLLPLYVFTIPLTIVLIIFDHEGFGRSQKERGEKVLKHYQKEFKGI